MKLILYLTAFSPNRNQKNGPGTAAVLPPLERLPDQHGLVVQAPQRREVLHRRHPRKIISLNLLIWGSLTLSGTGTHQ